MDGIADEPPPLDDMSMFLQRMRLHAKPLARGWSSSAFSSSTYDSRFIETKPKQNKGSLLDDSFSHPARIVESISDGIAEKLNSSNAEKESLKPLRRGFLNSAPEKKKKPPSDGKKRDLPFLKASAKSTEKDIPDFMRVSSPVDQYREELTRMLKPTQELVKDVMDNEGIKGGLEDPEIMAAVQDIANDPSAIHKYRNNPKVTTFYSHLGKLMGHKIENQTRQTPNEVLLQ